MRLYGFWRSIATFRVRTALNLKGVAFEETVIDLLAGEQHAASYHDINPGHAVPALEINGHTLTQSIAIIDALDTLYPEPRLIPADVYERAAMVAFALDTAADSHPLIVPRVRKRLAQQFGADEAATHAFAGHFIALTMDTIEARLGQHVPAPYVHGAAPGIADIAIAGHLVSCGLFGVDQDKWPLTKALGERLFAIDAFAKAHPLKIKAGAAAH
jgi:maleylacetoacetate isomerase